ncbi:MAG: glycosyltransferase family 39 protein [Anaerolineae bacterium]|nr:glycosyltransferase family 39 protein [Anaerolineae bacterium]
MSKWRPHIIPSSREHAGLALILAGFVVLALIYSAVTPVFEASDELWHYPMVKYMADHNLGLPVQDPAHIGPWRQEGGQPPLYYMLGAIATGWIDTSDMDTVRRLNQHADIGMVVPDGNANMILHDADAEQFPWRGTTLAVHIVRFLSIVMGAGTVYLTYRLGRELFPAAPVVALGAAAITAFNPMFLFISGVINNDNLSTLLATALLVLIVRLLNYPAQSATPRFYVVLGLAAGAGLLAKFQVGFLLPLIALALLITSIRLRDWRPVIVGGLISGGLTILIAGWWYWRNYDLYGDATGINVFLDIVGRRGITPDFDQLWSERWGFAQSYWGFFGGLNVPMHDTVYKVFNILAAVCVSGLVIGPVFAAARSQRKYSPREHAPAAANPAPRPVLARLLIVIWPVIVFFSLISWTRQTWASQGRLMFSAIAPLSIWMIVGLVAWARGSRRAAWGLAGIVTACFVIVAILVPFVTIRPAYSINSVDWWDGDTVEQDGYRAVCFAEPGDSGDDALCAAYQPLSGSVRPGHYARFSPTFTATDAITRNWNIFVHLVNEYGVIEAQRDVYPGGGLIATAELEDGKAWKNPLAIRVPEGLYTPQTFDVYMGLYDSATNERMISTGSGADTGLNRVLLGQITLEAPPGDVPNPLNVDFEGKLTLLGYEVSERSLAPGDELAITLYWEAQHRLNTDYVVSIQVIDPDPAKLTKAAQVDASPTPPTTAWTPGEQVAVTWTLPVLPDVAPGRYRVMVRVYPSGRADQLLRINVEHGGETGDIAWLNWMQVK